MKIAFFETQDWQKKYLEENLQGHEISFFEEALSQENIKDAKDCEAIAVFISSKLDKELLEKLPNLKMIVTMSTGYDHIDVESAKEKGIVVCNVPFYGENTVAEHTFALILALTRRIFDSVEKVRRGEFSVDGLRGVDLKNRTIGIIGLGHIGSHVARMAKGFEMNILAYDIKEDKKLAKKIGLKYVDLKELLSNSDIISLHVPYNKETHQMINLDNIGLIKKGSYLVNTSRGGLIDTTALLRAIGDGTLAGVGLDVLEEEDVIKEEAQLLSKDFPENCDLKVALENHVLLKQKNVIITPHNAFNSEEALTRILETTVLNIQSFIKNKIINNV